MQCAITPTPTRFKRSLKPTSFGPQATKPTPILVGNTGLEPVTSALSKQRSKPTELITRFFNHTSACSVSNFDSLSINAALFFSACKDTTLKLKMTSLMQLFLQKNRAGYKWNWKPADLVPFVSDPFKCYRINRMRIALLRDGFGYWVRRSINDDAKINRKF